MFRFEDRQLHMLLGLFLGASMLLFCFFCIGKLPEAYERGELKGMTDFSEAWVCTYVTEDKEKLEQYQSAKEKKDNGHKEITEIVNFPAEFLLEEGKTVWMTHKVPELGSDTVYMTLHTDKQAIRVYVGQDLLYSSEESEKRLPSFHVISIDPKYKNMVISIEQKGMAGNRMETGAIQVGSYTELLITAFFENELFLLIGILLVCISICMLVVWLFAKSLWRWRRLLLYCSLEGLLLGILLLTENRLVQIFVDWSLGMYFLQSCLVIITGVLHLMVMRCAVYKKKVLFLLDVGILLYGICYISVMVLQAFSLIQFDTIYLVGKVLFVISIVLYTIVLGVAIYDYERKEGKPVFYANILLLLSLLAQVIMQYSGRQEQINNIYIPIGFLFYMVCILLYGLKQIFYMEPQKESTALDDREIRAQVIKELNPNLLFASFHTLQNLIKNGSDKSIKMIYYISVYIRDNLKAMNQAGETIPFEEELEHMIAYLQLQKIRNRNLEFTVECKVKEFRVPRHSMEPMVENAVKHGIANQVNQGNIIIRTYQRAEGYAIQIIDDGAGFDKKVLTREGRTALLNLLTMLERTCQAKTEVVSKEGKGTVITMILPMLENDLMEKE